MTASVAGSRRTGWLVLLLAAVAVSFLGGGLAGARLASGGTPSPTPSAAPAAAATVAPSTGTTAKDNALVDRLLGVIAGGDRADFDAMVRPHFTFASTTASTGILDPAGMWSRVLDSRQAGYHAERTSDVTRIGDVLFWGGRWTSDDGGETLYTWTMRVALDGRLVNAWETVHS